MGKKILAAAALALSTGAVASQEELPAADIVVIGHTKPYRLTVKQLRSAVIAYERGRPVLAPASRLLFEVTDAPQSQAAELKLTLRSRTATVPISLDAKNRFVLPALRNDDWELVANRGRGTLSVRPIVLSPGTEVEERRLGDMRLQCEVIWAIEREHASIATRSLFGIAGGCKSTKMALYTRSERPIAEAAVIVGSRHVPISVLSDRVRYRVPLGDKSLSNDARVRFRFS